MNRQTRRNTIKAKTRQERVKFTLIDVQKAISIALEMRKESRGHLFKKGPKRTVCVFCGAGRRTKEDCEYSLLTFFDRMQTVLINPDFFRGDDKQANWLQQGEMYKDIRVPPKDEL